MPSTHSGRAVLGVVSAVWLIVCPPPCSWVLAAFLLLWSADHLKLAFRLAEREGGAAALPAETVRATLTRYPAERR